MEPPTVVIDNGTGFTKMGYAGNMDPSYLIPSTIATTMNKVSWKWKSALITIFIYYRKTQNSSHLKWTTILERKPWLIKRHIKLVICSKEVWLKIGKVLKSSGTNLYIHTSDASLKNIGLSWRSHQWTLLKTENKWLKSCLRHLAWKVFSLENKLLWHCTVKLLVQIVASEAKIFNNQTWQVSLLIPEMVWHMFCLLLTVKSFHHVLSIFLLLEEISPSLLWCNFVKGKKIFRVKMHKPSQWPLKKSMDMYARMSYRNLRSLIKRKRVTMENGIFLTSLKSMFISHQAEENQ